MNAKTIKALFVFIVGLLAAAVIVFGTLVAAQYNLGKKNAQRDFRSVLNNTASVFQRGVNNSAAIKQGMEGVFAAHENLAAITIYIDNAPVFAQQTSIGFISFSANSEPVITASSPMLLTLSATFNAAGGKTARASAAFYMLKPKSVYNAARISFLIILAATVMAILFVLVNQFSGQTPQESAAAKSAPLPEEIPAAAGGKQAAQKEAVPEKTADGGQEAESEEITADPTVQSDKQEPVSAQELAYIKEFPSLKSAKESPRAFTDIPAPEKIHDNDGGERVVERRRNVAVPEKIHSDTPNSISPTTGFTREAFLASRLEAELAHATELELDIALFVILLPELNVTSPAAAEIFKLVMRQFRFSDYIFEYKSTGIAAIVLNYSIDDSIKQAERLYVKLAEMIESHRLKLKFGIGVSNRTFRIISSDRLIGEADEAANRALENPETPIVALKIDPVKYREYLSTAKKA